MAILGTKILKDILNVDWGLGNLLNNTSLVTINMPISIFEHGISKDHILFTKLKAYLLLSYLIFDVVGAGYMNLGSPCNLLFPNIISYFEM